ncbi:unnamed protein product [Symbiodinium natans]|uniref:Uncharacterized protein n=1 Tax=Symbiodinium natans TaxID=878477 RepID=A0A812HV80_9DINO|nr:unnamed protein product [Symbiodinium natans]
MSACPIGAAFISKWRAACGDMADPDLWKRIVAHSALQHLANSAHKKILNLQELTSDVEVERDLVAAELQIMALEELLKQSPSPERDVPMCEERRAANGRKRAALPAAPPLGPMPDGTFRSTVDSWNRKRDRKWVEKKLGISEEGNSTTVFVNELDTSVVIAKGYRFFFSPDESIGGCQGPDYHFGDRERQWRSAWIGDCAFLYRNEPEDKKVLHWRSPRSDEYDACYRLACKEFCRSHWCMAKTVATAVWSCAIFLVLTSLCCCAVVGYKIGSQMSNWDRRELGDSMSNVCSSTSNV